MGRIYIVDKPLTQHIVRTLQQELYGKYNSARILLENRSTGTIFSAGGGHGITGAWDYNGALLYTIQSDRKNFICSISLYGNGGIILSDNKGYLEVWGDNSPDELSLLCTHQPHQDGGISMIQKVPDSELFIAGSYFGESIKLVHPLQGVIYKDIKLGDNVMGITFSLAAYSAISYGKYIICIIYIYIYYLYRCSTH